MATRIARNDALVVRQVGTLTPAAVNNATYDVKINGKSAGSITADGSATVQEIVEALQPVLEANALSVPEFEELSFTEDNTKIDVTGPTTGKPFTIVDNSSGGGTIAVATSVAAKSPNHWIAENFTGLTLPVSNDTVIISQLEQTQSFKWGLDQNGVSLTLLDIKADSAAHIGLPERNIDNGSLPYYEYRDTHLKISVQELRIGQGSGQGSGRIKLDLQTAVDCSATVYKTGQRADQDEAPVHLVGGTAASTLQVISGDVDLAMLPGYTGSWGTLTIGGGTTRCGTGVTLAVVEAAGNSVVETRSAITTARTRDTGRILHIGSGNITTADIQGGPLEIQATGALTIAQLNGYAGKTLDLRLCDSLVTLTATTIYATPEAPFTILDPNNKLVMTAAASTPNGAQSLRVITGSGRNVRVT